VKFGEPIAIVGMGGVFPGARSLDEFWQIIATGRDTSRPAPAGRWRLNPADILHPTPGTPDRVYTDRACFIEGFSLDPAGLALDRDLLAQLDPVVHLLLTAGRDAFASAKTTSLDRARIGVTLGHIALPTESSSKLCEEILTPLLEQATFGSGTSSAFKTHPLNRYVAGLPAGLLAQALGLGGGTRTLDAACASSLYALKLACDELHAGRVDAMLAGGVSRPDSLYTQMGFAQLRALATSGRCTPFDAAASGLIVGEGAGVVVLKRLSDALRDGDEIHALIRGIGLSNDLDGNLLSPASEGQLRALRLAYAAAGWEPESVEFIECHATGTPVGDAVEFSSLNQLWSDRTWQPGQCTLGAVKANVGHLLTGAGAAGLLKVLLSLRHNTLPPVANFQRASDKIPLGQSPFRALTQSQPWPKRPDGRPRRAAINGFGFGGINAHVLIEEWTGQPERRSPSPRESTPALNAGSETGAPPETPDAIPHPLPGVAIIGLATHIGPWRNLRSFTARVLGADTETQPAARPDWRGLHPEALAAQPGYFVDDLAIPVSRYRIPPRELAELLPQQALMLEVARDALTDARVTEPEATRTGVFIGLGLDLRTTDFHFRWAMLDRASDWANRLPADVSEHDAAAWAARVVECANPPLNADRTMGALAGTNASRIAKEFRIGGQSYTVCSDDTSGLSALEIAVRALQRGELDLALAGGVELTGDLRARLAETALHKDAIPGEGAVAIVLKRVEDAQRDGDRIYAMIRGVGAGSAGGLQPPPRLQSNAADGDCKSPARTLASARALAEAAFDNATSIPSATAEVGHTGAASGLVDLAKAALALHTQIIPARTAHADARAGGFQPPPLSGSEAPDGDWKSPAPQHWLRDRADGPRRAAITTTSVDGNAMSVVLEECSPKQFAAVPPHPDPLPPGEGTATQPARSPDALGCGPARNASLPLPAGEDRREGARVLADQRNQILLNSAATKHTDALFTFAAADTAGLLAQLDSFRQQAAAAPNAPLNTLAHRSADTHARSTDSRTLASALHRVAFIAQDRAQLARLLDAAANAVRHSKAETLDHRDRDQLFFTPPAERVSGKVAFVFPGAGNHFADMGRELGLLFPEVLRAQDRENERLASQLFAAQFWNATAPVTDQRESICGQVALGTFVSDIAVSLGLKPDAALGYSLGESTSLFALRAWTARDEMLARVTASTLFTKDLTGEPAALRRAWNLPADQPVAWQAGLVDRPAEEVRTAMAGLARTYILIVNTPRECVIGGDAEQVRALVAKLGCHFFALDGVSTVHCDLLQPVLEPYRELHRFPTTPATGVTFYSGGWGRSYVPDRETAADAIVAQASATIDFPRVVRAAYADGVRFYIEMGPGASCARMIGQILEGQPHIARSLCVSAKEPLLDVLRVVGALWAEGLPVNLEPLYGAVEEEAAPEPTGKLVIIPITGAPIVPPPLPTGSARVPRAESGVPPDSLGTPSVSVPRERKSDERGFQRDAENSTRDACAPPNDPFEAELLTAMAQAQATTLQAHEAYLAFSEGVFKTLSEAVQTQLDLVARAAKGASLAPFARGPLTPALSPGGGEGEELAHFAGRDVTVARAGGFQPPPDAVDATHGRRLEAAGTVPRSLTREQCFEFAIGKIGNALGATFAEADSFPTRVRLPDAPLQLVDRITAIEGEPRSMTHGRVVTEHDVHAGAWYLDCERIPTCIAVEAGQADLFLSGFLGIDFQTRGLAMYRLLDAKVCFHRSLPGPGETIRYDIRIERFFQQSGVWLFKFNFESTVNGQPLLTMSEGCAGFFTPQDLAAGKGVIRTSFQLKSQPGKRQADWEDFVPMAVESYSAVQLDALREGDLAACFGEKFAGLKLENPVTLPGGRMRLVHRIERLEPNGGRFGLGLIRGEADIHPDDWFITCHFVDDRVMPGTLMYECCLHTLRVHLLRLGWVAEARAGVALEPVPGVVGQLKCRGQVLETTKLVTYEIELREIGYGPEPYVIADALMYADGKAIVEISNMSLRYTGVTREELRVTWNAANTGRDVQQRVPTTKAALYGPERITAFSSGNPSEAFGEPYRIFDADAPRRIARLPRAPYQFLDRITEIRGCEAFKMVAGGEVSADYDVPVDEWYFAANRQGDMPFAILLEIALQPCGWLSGYLGSALTSSDDLSYRNLGGTGTQFAPVRPGVGTLTTRIKNTRLSSSAGMIIQWFDFEVWAGAEKIYRGDTYFGFFPKAALEKQEGIKGAKLCEPSAAELARAKSLPYPTTAPFADTMLRMVDDITVFIADGGPKGLGFIRGTKRVNPDEWFFQAHFYQDPVVPGSLGLESFLQLLKFAAVERWGHAPTLRWEAVAMNAKHEWVYRGQVIPRDSLVTVEAIITACDDEQRLLTADGFLSVDGRVIYGMKNFTVRGVSESQT
jgi:acyl transferase domain-containing protein/3-hydroxymyristoyl/3-hydroxydecanoyl-(acyl carrier protein) dehydratase